MDYFKKLIEKSETNYIFEHLGKRPLGIHNMRKIKILPFQCGSPSPAFRRYFEPSYSSMITSSRFIPSVNMG